MDWIGLGFSASAQRILLLHSPIQRVCGVFEEQGGTTGTGARCGGGQNPLRDLLGSEDLPGQPGQVRVAAHFLELQAGDAQLSAGRSLIDVCQPERAVEVR